MPVAETELARAISARTWAQFQLSGFFPDTMELILTLIGDVTKVEIRDGGFKCRSDDPLRAHHGGWEQARQAIDSRRHSRGEDEDRNVSVHLPANRVVIMKLTPLGRLLLVACNARENLVLMLFPQGDSGDIEMFEGLTIEPIDLVRARAMATT